MADMPDPIQRLKNIVRNGVKLGARVSDGMLLREYMRRLARLERRSSFDVSGLFFDPAELPGVNRMQLDQEREQLSELTRDMTNKFCAALLEDYVLWIRLARQGNPVAALEPDLFEPLVRMFERRAAFRLHHGEALFQNFAISLYGWRSNADGRIIEIDEDQLARWDNRTAD